MHEYKISTPKALPLLRQKEPQQTAPPPHYFLRGSECNNQTCPSGYHHDTKTHLTGTRGNGINDGSKVVDSHEGNHSRGNHSPYGTDTVENSLNRSDRIYRLGDEWHPGVPTAVEMPQLEPVSQEEDTKNTTPHRPTNNNTKTLLRRAANPRVSGVSPSSMIRGHNRGKSSPFSHSTNNGQHGRSDPILVLLVVLVAALAVWILKKHDRKHCNSVNSQRYVLLDPWWAPSVVDHMFRVILNSTNKHKIS